MSFDGLILDIDGTIWDTTSVVAGAWNSAIEKTFPSVPRVSPAVLKMQFGKPMNVIADNLFKGLDDAQKTELMRACCEEEEKALESEKRSLAYDGVVQTLERISKKIPVFIVSNCQDGYIQLVMKKNGIENFITDFESFGRTGKSKGENILSVMKRNGLSNPVYVGDTQGDFDECRKVHVAFVWARYGLGELDSRSEKDAFGVINQFSEIEQILFL